MYSTSTSAIEEGKTLSVTGPLTKLQAHDLIMGLTREERTALLTALQEFQAEKRKAEYEGRIYYVSESESFRPVISIYIEILLRGNKISITLNISVTNLTFTILGTLPNPGHSQVFKSAALRS